MSPASRTVVFRNADEIEQTPDTARTTAAMNVPALVKAALTPGSIAFLLLCVVIWLVLKYVWPGIRRVAAWWITGVVGLYVVLALPCVATGIAGRLPAVPTTDLSGGQSVDTLVVLDGDNRVGRVREALRVYRVVSVGKVIVLGDAWIADKLAAEGISSAQLTTKPGPGTTRGQIEWIKERLPSRPGVRIALIASRLQMPRVAALARSAGLSLALATSEIDDEPPTSGLRRFIPTYIGLRTSRDALYEHAALVYYRWRGWIN